MFKEFTLPAAAMGLLAAFVGYAASFSIILTGLTNIGATQEQAATGLFFASLGMALCSIWLPTQLRIPAAVAWSTPGAAFLASAKMLNGGFAEATGAMIMAACLIVATGLVPALGRMVAAIPKPVANALLAGVVFQLCLAPAIALGAIPLLFLPVLIAWLAGLTWHRLAAMPCAVVTFLAVTFVTMNDPQATTSAKDWLPALTPIAPIFSLNAFISVAVPLYLVTMAGQNIPGFAVLELNGYKVDRQPLIRNTGIMSLIIAPFGSVPVNMSAITAAMMSGADAGPDPSKRYWSAITSGVAYVGLTLLAGLAASLSSIAPAELITAIAGLALIPALIASFNGAFSIPNQIEAPALTFLIAASGMTLLDISAAFWALVVGVAIWHVKAMGNKTSN